jgi:hypothetical protein
MITENLRPDASQTGVAPDPFVNQGTKEACTIGSRRACSLSPGRMQRQLASARLATTSSASRPVSS